MSRPKRNFRQHSYYHIYNRGNNKDEVIKNSDDKQFFISKLYSNIQKTDLRLVAYCIMDNHFHLILKTGKKPACISKYMQQVTVSFAIHINKKYKRTGHSFQGRYNAKFLRYKKDLERVKIYIKMNPVTDGIVRKPKGYPWSKF